jgi:hypothetical protein
MAAVSSAGQSMSGGSASVAGRPRRRAAVGASRFACTRALMKWVVPIITAAMSEPSK